MGNNKQHIKNFFNFIEEKDGRKIPLSMKFSLFNNELTEDEINMIKYDMHALARAKLFNKKIHDNLFWTVKEFGIVSPSVAFAVTPWSYIFINFNVEKSVEGIDFSKINNKQGNLRFLTAYYNSIQDDFTYQLLEYRDGLIISTNTNNNSSFKRKDGHRSFLSLQPINVNTKGWPDPNFVPKNEKQKMIQKYTNTFLNEIKKYNPHNLPIKKNE